MEKDKKQNENALWIKKLKMKIIKLSRKNGVITSEEVQKTIKKLVTGNRLVWTNFLTSELK